jgi:hypothetical protein
MAELDEASELVQSLWSKQTGLKQGLFRRFSISHPVLVMWDAQTPQDVAYD